MDEIYTLETHKIIVTEESLDFYGCWTPKRYNLEDGTELELAEVQTVNVTDTNGNGGANPLRFIKKQ